MPELNLIDSTIPPSLDVLFEDNHLIAVNKPPGEAVQKDKSGDQPLSERVRAFLKSAYGKPGRVYLGIAHRLDRPTSGAIVFARTSKALSRLNQSFREGEVNKRYWAVVCNPPPESEGELVNYLVRDRRRNKSFVTDRSSKTQEARLGYRTLLELDRYTVLDIQLYTGRHHQIRAQLAAIGCYIKGDLKYGAPHSNPNGGIHLHARELGFTHPVRNNGLTIVAEPPTDTLWDMVVG